MPRTCRPRSRSTRPSRLPSASARRSRARSSTASSIAAVRSWAKNEREDRTVTVSFLASDLAKWDQLEGAPEALVLPFFSDERPLRGAAGLCDWRLCGRLSRLLASGRVQGQWGETTLYPPGK